MLSSTETLIFAAGLLVLLGSLPAPARPRPLPAVAFYLVTLFLSAFLVHRFVDAQGLVPPTRPRALVRYGLKQMQRAPQQNVIVIDGGSYPSYGVNPELLERRLKKLGYSVRVVHLALGAGNHFERHKLQEEIVAGLGKKRRKGQRRIYLTEAHLMYDQEPLAQLGSNHDTARAYDYLTLPNAWYGLRALGVGFAPSAELGFLPWTVVRHSLVNSFNAGIASRVVESSKVKPRTGFARRGRKKGDFPGLEEAMRALSEPKEIDVPAWVFSIREARDRRLWESYVTDWVYFGLPSARPDDLSYVRSFCKITQEQCIAPDIDLMKRLDARKYWFDSGHMTQPGAEIYTTWLASQLAASDVLAK